MLLARNAAFIVTRVDDEIVMLNAETGDFIGLNATGAAAWDQLETPQDMDALCRALGETFEVDAATCRREVQPFIDDMMAHDAIRMGQGGGEQGGVAQDAA